MTAKKKAPAKKRSLFAELEQAMGDVKAHGEGLSQDLPMRAQRPPSLGSRIQFEMGNYVIEGTIVEDRRNLGVNGQHVWRVRVGADDQQLTYQITDSRITQVFAG